jgi:hypothetical protein
MWYLFVDKWATHTDIWIFSKDNQPCKRPCQNSTGPQTGGNTVWIDEWWPVETDTQKYTNVLYLFQEPVDVSDVKDDWKLALKVQLGGRRE